MKNIDAGKLHNEIETFIAERDWDQFHSVKNLSMALNVESAELMEIFQWMSEEKSNQLKDDPVLMEKIRDELADIFFFLLRISAKADIDLELALLSKLRKNAEKYPVEKARGSSKKYTEF